MDLGERHNVGCPINISFLSEKIKLFPSEAHCKLDALNGLFISLTNSII